MAPVKREKTRTEWPTPMKNRIRSLYYAGNWTQSAISSFYNVPQRSVSRLVQSDSERRDGKNRSGRPKSLTPEQVDQLVTKATTGWNGRVLAWKELAHACGLSVSFSILWGILSLI